MASLFFDESITFIFRSKFTFKGSKLEGEGEKVCGTRVAGLIGLMKLILASWLVSMSAADVPYLLFFEAILNEGRSVTLIGTA